MIRLAPILPVRVPRRIRPRKPSVPLRRKIDRRYARQSVIAAGLSLLFLLPVLWFAAESARPNFLDPSYCYTLSAFRAVRTSHPDSRLCVMIGSSRTQCGFAPERLGSQVDAAGRPVLWFNVSHYEAGPGMNYVILRRLLRDGPPPALVVVELMPAFCVRAEADYLAHLTTYRDAAACLSAAPPGEWLAAAVKRRITGLRDLWAGLGGREPYLVAPPGPFGGGPYPKPAFPDERRRKTAVQIAWLGDFLQIPTVHPGSDRATRALIGLCHDRKIELVFVRTPESTEFRAAYDPAGLARFDAWIRGLVREFGVRVIDARYWLPDEQFVDGQHPTTAGAETFTGKLVREVGPVK
ncbi:MAG TPA: hypothetical protein VGJ05_18510 [Fimbriiglobus sp.]